MPFCCCPEIRVGNDQTACGLGRITGASAGHPVHGCGVGDDGEEVRQVAEEDFAARTRHLTDRRQKAFPGGAQGEGELGTADFGEAAAGHEHCGGGGYEVMPFDLLRSRVGRHPGSGGGTEEADA